MMPTERGFVEELQLSRAIGKVTVRPEFGLSATFTLYSDSGVTMIDPTEMVRRNWMIGTLQQAAAHRMEVTISFPSETDGRVRVVSLHAGLPKTLLFSFSTTWGTVKRVEVGPGTGGTTIHGVTTTQPGPPQGDQSPEDHDLIIYTYEGGAPVPAEETSRRSRVVALLRQALIEGLVVSVVHGTKPNAPLISSVTLHAEE